MEFCAVVMILCPFKPMYPLEYRDMDTGNTGDYHAPDSLPVSMADESHGDRLQNNNTSIDRRANIVVANNIFVLV